MLVVSVVDRINTYKKQAKLLFEAREKAGAGLESKEVEDFLCTKLGLKFQDLDLIGVSLQSMADKLQKQLDSQEVDIDC